MIEPSLRIEMFGSMVDRVDETIGMESGVNDDFMPSSGAVTGYGLSGRIPAGVDPEGLFIGIHRSGFFGHRGNPFWIIHII